MCFTNSMTDRKKEWTLVYKGPLDNFDNASFLSFWRSQSTAAKFAETKALIEQAMTIQGKSYENVSRFLRTTAVLKRT